MKRVVGSSPSSATTKINKLGPFGGLFLSCHVAIRCKPIPLIYNNSQMGVETPCDMDATLRGSGRGYPKRRMLAFSIMLWVRQWRYRPAARPRERRF